MPRSGLNLGGRLGGQDGTSGSAVDTSVTPEASPHTAPAPSHAPAKQRPTMNAASVRFYEDFARRQFDDAQQPMSGEEIEAVIGKGRLGEIVARSPDPVVRELGNAGAKVSPMQLFIAYQAQLADDQAASGTLRPSEIESAFTDSAEWAQSLIKEIRGKRVYGFAGQLQSDSNILEMLGGYEPELLLASRLAEHSDLGGTSVLSRALDRAYVPADVLRLLTAQVGAMPRIESTVSQAAANARVAEPLRNSDVVYGLLAGVRNIAEDITLVRKQWDVGGKRPAVSPSRVRDAADLGRLPEIFGSMQGLLNRMPGARETVELVFMLQRLLADPDTSIAVKRAALVGLDEAIRRATADKPGVKGVNAAGVEEELNVCDGLPHALHRFSDSASHPECAIKTIGTMVNADVVKSILENALRVTNDPRFAADVINTGLQVDAASVLFENAFTASQRSKIAERIRDGATPENAVKSIALAGDRAERTKLLEAVLAASPALTLDAQQAALVLDWPASVPRNAVANAAPDLARLPASNLSAVMDSPAGKTSLGPVFQELLASCANLRFSMNGPDVNIEAEELQIITGKKALSRGWNPMAQDPREKLVSSRAVQALPLQLQEKIITVPQLKERIVEAVRTRNGALFEVLPSLFTRATDGRRAAFDAIRSAIETGTGQKPSLDETKFELALLAACSTAFASSTDPTDRNLIEVAVQKALKRSDLVSLTRYMGNTAEENLEALLKLPQGAPQFSSLFDTLDLPDNAGARILARAESRNLAPQAAYAVFAQLLDNAKTDVNEVARAAVSVLTNNHLTGTAGLSNAYVTFTELAARNFGAPVGKQIIDGIVAADPDSTRFGALQSVAVACAAEGRLFDANDVAEWMLASKNNALLTKVCTQNTEFTDKVSPAVRTRMVAAVLTGLKGSVDASVFDLARPAFALVTELKASGAALPASALSDMTAIAANAIVRAGLHPIEAAGLRNILGDAADAGVDVAKLANALLKRDDPFATLPASAVLAPEVFPAACLELARAMPGLDLASFSAMLRNASTPGPVASAFDVFMEGPHEGDTDAALCEAGIRWAAELGDFPAVLAMRRRLEEPGFEQPLAVFDAALTAAVATRPDVWQGVPEARSVVARIKLGAMADSIAALAKGGSGAAAIADELVGEIAGSGSCAAELVPQVLDAVRRQTRAHRPSLDEVQVVMNVPTTPPRREDAVRVTNRKVDFYGIAPVTVYSGGKGYGARVPEIKKYIATPGVTRNARKLIAGLESDKPIVLVMGKPGVGKTFTTEQYAALTETPYVEVDGGPELTSYDLRGSWSSDRHGNAIYKKKEVLLAAEKGGLVCFDEINASTWEYMLSVGAMVASRHSSTSVRTDRNENLKVHEQFKAVFNGNFIQAEIPKQIRKYVHIVYMDALSIEDQKQIVAETVPSLDPVALELLATMQTNVEQTIALTEQKGEYALSARNMLRAAKRTDRYRGMDPAMAAARAARETYLDGIVDRTDVMNDKGEVAEESDYTRLAKTFETVFGMKPEDTLAPVAAIGVKQTSDRLSIGDASIRTGPQKPVAPAEIEVEAFGAFSPFIMGERETRELEQMAKSMELGESMLYRAGDDTSVLTMARAFGQLSGWGTHVQSVNEETTEFDMFGGDTQRETDDGKTETYFDGGWVTDVARNGGVLVINDVDELSDAVRIKLHRMLAERRVPGPGGTLEPMSANALIIMRSDKTSRLGEAFVNRLQQRSLAPRTPAETLDTLTKVAQRLGVAPIIAQSIMRYDEMWRRAVHNVIATDVSPKNMPIPTLGKQIHWLQDFKSLIDGECYNPDILFTADGKEATFDEQIENQFVFGGLAYYPVPDNTDAQRQLVASDMEKCETMLRALAQNRPDDAEAILK